MLSKYKNLQKVLDVYRLKSYALKTYVSSFREDKFDKSDDNYKRDIREQAFKGFVQSEVFNTILEVYGYLESSGDKSFIQIKENIKELKDYRYSFEIFCEKGMNSRRYMKALEQNPYGIPIPHLIFSSFVYNKEQKKLSEHPLLNWLDDFFSSELIKQNKVVDKSINKK
jgi:hypothetical protein